MFLNLKYIVHFTLFFSYKQISFCIPENLKNDYKLFKINKNNLKCSNVCFALV